jgi:hypothetical protein
MVDVVLRQTHERQGLVFANRDIRAWLSRECPGRTRNEEMKKNSHLKGLLDQEAERNSLNEMDRSALGRISAVRNKSVAVEEWLDGLVHDHREKNKGKPLANGTKVKIRTS